MSAKKENPDSKNQNGLPCPDCEGQLILQKDSNNTDVKDMDHQLFSCSSCELRLEIHVEDDLPKNGAEKRFQCDICNRFYTTPITLKVHRLLHTTGKNELCDLCGASFKTRGQLKIHRRIHTGEKPYKCNECDKSFPYRESLITHSTVHTRIKPFMCVVCNAKFSCIGNLLKHRRTRPNKCGLESIPISRIGPRPNKKTMPSLTDRQVKEPYQKETTCPTDAVEPNEIIEVCQDEMDLLSDRDDATKNVQLYTHLSVEKKFAKDEKIPEDHDRLYADEEGQNHSIVEYETTNETESDANDAKTDASSPAAPEWQMNDSVDTISENDEKKLWEYVHVEPDQSNDSSTAPETLESSNKNKRKTESFESLALLLDKPDEESIQQEQEQLKLLRELSEPVDAFYRCTLCPQQYTTLYLLARHLERLHNVTLDRARKKLQYEKNTTKHEKRYRCNYCEQRYVNQTCLRKHILKHGPDGCWRCKCPCCDKYFLTQEETHQHELEQHRDRLECKDCQKWFKTPQQLVSHIRNTHSSTDGRHRNKYMCSQCSKNFASKIALSDHERAECGKSPIYPCGKCDKQYSSYSSLKMHQMLHENSLPFVCCFCGKKFNTKGQQKVHERSHTGEKPYRCDECMRTFAHQASLVTHLSIHTGVKRYGCADCDGRFSCITNLQAHRRVHHKAMGGGTGTPKSDFKTGEH